MVKPVAAGMLDGVDAAVYSHVATAALALVVPQQGVDTSRFLKRRDLPLHGVQGVQL